MASCEIKNEVEEIIKFNVKDMVKDSIYEWFEIVKSKGIYQGDFDDYYDRVFQIQSFKNYYHVWFCGLMFDNFIFNKEGKLIFRGKTIHELDDENFIFFDYHLKRNTNKVYHFRIPGEYFDYELVNSFENFDNVEEFDFFSKEGLVIFSYGESNMLYNYKTGEVLIPSFSEISFDFGNFKECVKAEDINKYVRVIKRIYGIENYMPVLDSQLEFLIDKSGKIVSIDGELMEVHDFINKSSYALVFDGVSQERFLKGVYKQVWNINNKNRKKVLTKENK